MTQPGARTAGRGDRRRGPVPCVKVFPPVVDNAPTFAGLVERLLAVLPEPAGDDSAELAYAEAMARQLAARRTVEALELFERLPNVKPETVERARRPFVGWERDAIASLDELDRTGQHGELRRRQAEVLTRMTTRDALDELSAIGLLPAVTARRAAEALAEGAEAERS